MAVVCYIGLGSNVGDREENLRGALALLRESGGIEVTKVSSFHETAPVGGPPQGKFLNAAAEVRTALAPEELLDRLQAIERNLGRERTVKWGPRTVDLDILLYGDVVIQTERLTVPHPLMHERRFVLGPLNEIAPGAVHPVFGKTVSELLGGLDDVESR
ncbi:MAG: 2-amino-4-hydroxy-6-hydroxymethyldihydropteridine diphosphokinase [Planctomycetota bacterium]